jgi:transposase
MYKAYDTVQKTWRHLNFFEHECHLHARVPRIKRDDGKVRLIPTPWDGQVSGFTLLFEALLMQLCKAMPVHNVSQLTGVSDHKIWRVLDTYIGLAKKDEDFSDISVVGMDETSIARGHSFFSTYLINRLIDKLYNMKLIKSNLGPGQVFFNSFNEGGGHIATDVFNGISITLFRL